MKFSKFNFSQFVALAFAASAGMAQAAVDVTEIAGAKTEIAAVGTAVFGVYLAIKLTKWVRRAL